MQLHLSSLLSRRTVSSSPAHATSVVKGGGMIVDATLIIAHSNQHERVGMRVGTAFGISKTHHSTLLGSIIHNKQPTILLLILLLLSITIIIIAVIFVVINCDITEY